MNSPSPARILIADDDALVVEAIQETLEAIGYVVAGKVADGDQAVEATQALRPDVVLMDIKMPKMDGLTAARQIQDCCPTPVVLLTAFESQDLVELATEAGVGAYLIKPPQAREMRRAIAIARARFEDMVALRRLNAELQEALTQVKLLSGLLPICASCKRIRDDDGHWQPIESYIRDRSEARFSHGLCTDCAQELYPDLDLFEDGD
ncbi:MAG: response regulator [Anaerolineae bacterium]|jgi:AmiR/NasT family two-component response regulator